MTFQERVQKRYDAMAGQFSSLDEMTADMLMSYCTICVQIDDLNSRIESDGYFISTDKGLKENPAVNTVHKLNADKARYFAPLKRYLSKQQLDAVDGEFEEFLR